MRDTFKKICNFNETADLTTNRRLIRGYVGVLESTRLTSDCPKTVMNFTILNPQLFQVTAVGTQWTTYLTVGYVDPQVYVSKRPTANPSNDPVFSCNQQFFSKPQHLLERRHRDCLSFYSQFKNKIILDSVHKLHKICSYKH